MFRRVSSYVPFCGDRETGRSPGMAEILETEPPHTRNWDGASAPNRGPKSLGTEDRAHPPQGGRELPHRFGGTGGRSVLRPETVGGYAERFGDRGFGRGTRPPVFFGRWVAAGPAARSDRGHDCFGGSGGLKIARSEGSRKAARLEGGRRVARPEGARRRGDPESEREDRSFG